MNFISGTDECFWKLPSVVEIYHGKEILFDNIFQLFK